MCLDAVWCSGRPGVLPYSNEVTSLELVLFGDDIHMYRVRHGLNLRCPTLVPCPRKLDCVVPSHADAAGAKYNCPEAVVARTRVFFRSETVQNHYTLVRDGVFGWGPVYIPARPWTQSVKHGHFDQMWRLNLQNPQGSQPVDSKSCEVSTGLVWHRNSQCSIKHRTSNNGSLMKEKSTAPLQESPGLTAWEPFTPVYLACIQSRDAFFVQSRVLSHKIWEFKAHAPTNVKNKSFVEVIEATGTPD